MIASFRKYLVVVLVLLQFIAPLVHAHTCEHGLSHGLHVPGLEGYEDFRSQDALVLALTVKPCSLGDGQVVGVGTGLVRDIAMQRLHKMLADLDCDYDLPPQVVVFKTTVFVLTTALTTQSVSLPDQLAYLAHSPRAPPTQA